MTAPAAGAGTVYLLHFDRPYVPYPGAPAGSCAQHYIGWAKSLEARLAHHAAGTGARLLAAVTAAGIGWQVAATWPGGRDLERRLKRRGSATRFCPACRAATAAHITGPGTGRTAA